MYGAIMWQFLQINGTSVDIITQLSQSEIPPKDRSAAGLKSLGYIA
jgi:hypothetical protein